MGSANLATVKIDDLDIIGYSVAGEETVVAIPQLDVCFDVGRSPQQIIPINHVLLTHGHMDHSAGIAYYLSQRNFCGLKAGTVLAPAVLTDSIRDLVRTWEKLDGQRIPATIVPMREGDEFEVKPGIFARAFGTRHTQGSVGYSIVEKRKKLRPELHNLSSPELVELKKEGEKIDYIVEIPIATYFGDTGYMDFWKHDYIANSRILIIECTFLIDEHMERAQAGRHMHLSEFNGLLERMHNEHIIITHLSQRTGPGEGKNLLRKALPADV
ncbi:MAG TPA: MBL fold metallo-hydrolase, partial [Sedimentisphaerales bacterium]|nr:MBL fold metallo-hydrolase [Sedimentisphaerales bacterium]